MIEGMETEIVGANRVIEEMPQEPVDQAIFLVRVADRAVSATRHLLHRIFAEKLYEGRYSSFGEFVENGLGKSQGWASKQLAVYRHFHLEGGIGQDALELDTEKLYLASKTEGTPEEQLSRAKTLTRSELKQEKNEAQPHKGDFASICRTCWVEEENHN